QRGLIGIGLLSAACIVGVAIAALVSQSSRGGGVKPDVTRSAAQLVSASSLPPEKQPLPTRPDAPPVQMAAAAGATAQAVPAAQTAPQGATPAAPGAGPTATAAAPAAAGSDSEVTQSLQTMARDLTKLQQGIAELKA